MFRFISKAGFRKYETHTHIYVHICICVYIHTYTSKVIFSKSLTKSDMLELQDLAL